MAIKELDEVEVGEFEFEPIQPKTPAMERLLSAGYGGMTVKKAQQIIKEREANPTTWPYEKYEQAQAFLEAYNAPPPAPTATDKPAPLGRRIEDME